MTYPVLLTSTGTIRAVLTREDVITLEIYGKDALNEFRWTAHSTIRRVDRYGSPDHIFSLLLNFLDYQ